MLKRLLVSLLVGCTVVGMVGCRNETIKVNAKVVE